MEMLKFFADYITYKLFGLLPESYAGAAVNFFIYDTVKIFILLGVIIFIVSTLRTFVPPEKVKRILSRKNKYTGNILAALIGIITPFCTCSAISLFLGFIEAGVPLGATFSFLVSSPMINEVALVLLLGLFGWKIALIYVFSGLVIAIFSGIIIGRLKPEKLLENLFDGKRSYLGLEAKTWRERIEYAKNYTLGILQKVWLYIVLGIGVAAWFHGYVPADFLANYVSNDSWYTVPLAVLIGVPLYANAAGVIPLVGVLTEKGISMGTALAFMMAVTGLSLPEFMILKRVMKIKLIVIFAAIVTIGIIFTGYLFNAIL
ncbi:MAG: Permease family protein [Parcubacteria group bacterium GW2011_GWF2_39_13b]|nr:MAG: Permease family protein [Parcubacteria group bacterium GW2011_GWF2_39_13b]